MHERPSLVVGLGIGVGTALGALLPWNRIDTEYLGDQAEKLADNALELAGDGYEKVKSAAQTTYDTAAETLGVKKNGSAETSVARPSETYGTYRG
jgi:ElaB/YqjD/DUF883 family membrane-anchored ribosome-binding protein